MIITEDRALELVKTEVNKLWTNIESISNVSMNDNHTNQIRTGNVKC